MKRIHLLATAAILLASVSGAAHAAPPQPVYVQGNPPTVYAEPNVHQVVRNADTGEIVRSSDGKCVRTSAVVGADECSFGLVGVEEKKQVQQKTRAAISRDERTVYFGFNQASLSPEAKSKLDTLANDIRSEEQVKGERIVGFADRIGSADYNERLSKKRAENVKGYLAAKGLLNVGVADTRWFGESEPSTSCPNNLTRAQLIDCLQPDRRVEVEIDYANDQRAAR